MLASTFSLLALVASPFLSVSAAPLGFIPPPPVNGGHNLATTIPTSFTAPGFSCPLTNAKIDITAGQGLAVPSGAPKMVALGVGVQNYTCSSAGTYTSVGAVAKLYDISCAIGTPLMNVSNSAATAMLKTLATKTAPIASHFFVNQTGALDPRFNQEPFAKSQSFATLSKTASIASPQGATNVAWLQLSNVAGSLASSVYRLDTQLGQPPASCDPTNTAVISVDYSAKYWFFP